MANTFTRKRARSVGTAAVRIENYTVPAATTATIIGLSVANTSNAPVSVDVYHFDGTNITYFIKGAPLPVGSSLAIVGGDQKQVLLTGDGVFVASSAAASVDVLMSILETT